MNRFIDWDVDGLRVWCDACRPKEQCEACEEAEELERDWVRYEQDPYYTGPAPASPRPEGRR